MSRLRLIYQILATLACTIFIVPGSKGQAIPITLERAIQVARSNHAGLARDRLAVEQNVRLAEGGLPAQPTQLFLSGEEFNFIGQSGVQSLNIQQNFYLPKAVQVQRSYFEQGVSLAERQVDITIRELDLNVKLAFYRLLFAREELDLASENVGIYNDFVEITGKMLELGEEGQIPLLAARSRIGQAMLEREKAVEKIQIARVMFNKWLRSDTLFEASGGLRAVNPGIRDTIPDGNPHLQMVRARKDLAEARIETAKAQLLPQINSGLRLQNAFGDFPLFGYQLGVNMPLFRKSQRARIESAQVGVKVQEAAEIARREEIDRTVSELQLSLKYQLNILQYLQNELLPLVDRQVSFNLAAFREGEASYLAYLDSLEQSMKLKAQYLDALYKATTLHAEIDYWLGND